MTDEPAGSVIPAQAGIQRVQKMDPGFRPGVGKTSAPFGAVVVKDQGTEPLATDGRFDVRSGGRDRVANVLAGSLADAAIRDDRTYKACGPGVRSTAWITWLYSKYTTYFEYSQRWIGGWRLELPPRVANTFSGAPYSRFT